MADYSRYTLADYGWYTLADSRWYSIARLLTIGYGSFTDFVFVLGVGMYFGYIVTRTRSILGVSVAHGLINVSLFLVLPLRLGGR